MPEQMKSWDERIDEVWADASGEEVGAEIIARIDALAAERGADDARAEFERAGARDSAGRPEEAVPLYPRALELGLDEEHRPQAVIQLASTIRNLGKLDEALDLLRAEYERDAGAPMHDAAAAFYALALVSSGKAVRAASVALTALAPHLPRYTRSVAAYARDLVDPQD